VSAQPALAGGAGRGSMPRHIAIIMDGNGRWAKKRMLPRVAGHRKGVEAVRTLAQAALDLGLECLTLYAFSTENWSRPADEVSDLMGLLRRFIEKDIDELHSKGVRLRVIGDWEALAPDLVSLLSGAIERTSKNERATLVVALNYGAQAEIVRAAKRAAAQGEITQQSLEAALDTADLPPLDLLIRTSGEVRLSNFLLWQAAYAEMLFVDTLWPDFGKVELEAAMHSFAARERRYGGL
jgi:undecaprenyl diphosphate synthase